MNPRNNIYMKSVRKIENMKQIDFQMLVGKIEVVGELLIKNEDN